MATPRFEYGNPQAYEKAVLATGSAHPALARDIAADMGIELAQVQHHTFHDGERWVRYDDSVRGKHVFVMQTHVSSEAGSINDAIQEQLLMIDAANGASADYVSVVTPHFGYARQDRKVVGRDPGSVRVVMDQLAVVGAKRIVAMDMHSPQSQLIFRGVFDHLTAHPQLSAEVAKLIEGLDKDGCVVVSPDAGAGTMSERHRKKLGVELLHLPKIHDSEDSSLILRSTQKVDGVDGKVCVMFDDIIATASTLSGAAEVLKNSGASKIIVAATHGLFVGKAYKNLLDAPIDEVIITDTLPTDNARSALGDKLRVVSMAHKIGQALFEIITNGSVSRIFEEQNHM